jgi:hypothetical protein
MRFFQKTNIQSLQEIEPVAVYFGRKIYLKRVQVSGTDKGFWLHWYHPQDSEKHHALRYGHFCAPGQTLEAALYEVYRTIDANLELELQYQQKITSRPNSASNDRAMFTKTAQQRDTRAVVVS